jgi:hypothetical protein
MADIPPELVHGPFTRAQASKLGITNRMLNGPRFARVYPRVWRLTDYEMTEEDWRTAALLALPAKAHLTGISRIQELGLHYGPRLPIRCVIQGTLHLAFEDVFLHRTKKLPPLDDVGVTAEAAYIFYCVQARVIDAIKVGDWLLHNDHMDLEKLKTLALAELWRPGAHEALWVSNHLNARSRSLKESETRSILEFAGLSAPEVNVELDLAGEATAIGDLVYRKWGTVVEYEGLQHQEDRDQYESDIDRYALLRAHHHRYVQVTNERLQQPRRLVLAVHHELVNGGYDGPPPHFGEQWRMLFLSLRIAVGPRDNWVASS